MGEKVFMKGNEALGEAAVRSGCRLFFGYPITPASELAEYMAYRLPQVGGVFIQAESEVAASNMIYGAGAAGKYAMTASSSPGVSLMQEAISYMAGAEVPAVIINLIRGGPGLGDIQPAQSDYFQAVKGGGHGDYRNLVYAPSTLQEAVDLMPMLFQNAFKYRMLAMMVVDGLVGQMMEAVEFKYDIDPDSIPVPDWALSGKKMHGGKKNVNTSLELDPNKLAEHNFKLFEKYQKVYENERMFEAFELEEPDIDVMIVAYGTAARIIKTAVKNLRAKGYKVGLFRPITLWPFPDKELKEYAEKTEHILTVEMSMGQLIEDVKLSIFDPNKKYHLMPYPGGIVPTPKEVEDKVIEILKGGAK